MTSHLFLKKEKLLAIITQCQGNVFFSDFCVERSTYAENQGKQIHQKSGVP